MSVEPPKEVWVMIGADGVATLVLGREPEDNGGSLGTSSEASRLSFI